MQYAPMMIRIRISGSRSGMIFGFWPDQDQDQDRKLKNANSLFIVFHATRSGIKTRLHKKVRIRFRIAFFLTGSGSENPRFDHHCCLYICIMPAPFFGEWKIYIKITVNYFKFQQSQEVRTFITFIFGENIEICQWRQCLFYMWSSYGFFKRKKEWLSQ